MTTSNDDSFEESSGTADTTVTYKYAQIVVPDFKMDVTSSSGTAPTWTTDGTEDGNRITSGSSFIRLGSYPDLTATSPSGFANSAQLAKLVGCASDIESTEADDDAPADDGLVRVEEDGAYHGDDNYLLGFADDTRYRDPEETTFIAGQTCKNTTTARKQETERLLTKGGWWDHSDGNRVTTTSGDKVEVIQGNYKLVILGRRDPASDPDDLGDNVQITDASGGMGLQQGMDPEGICIEYALEDGRWSILQTETGNQTQKLHGKSVEYFTGPRMESYVGRDPDQDDDEDNYPHIIDKTWAKKIDEHYGSVDKPIDSIWSKTYALSIEEQRYATNINSVTSAVEVTDVTTAVVTEVVIGEFNEITGVVKIEISPFKIEALIAKEEFIFYDRAEHALEEKLTGLATAICATESKILGINSTLTGQVTDIRGSVTKIQGEVTDIKGVQTEMAAEVTSLGVVCDELFEEVFLG